MFDLPANQWVAVAPSDTIDLDAFSKAKRLTSSVYVGTGGDVALVDESGTATTFPNVQNGSTLFVAVRRVNASGTAASGIVACYTI